MKSFSRQVLHIALCLSLLGIFSPAQAYAVGLGERLGTSLFKACMRVLSILSDVAEARKEDKEYFKHPLFESQEKPTQRAKDFVDRLKAKGLAMRFDEDGNPVLIRTTEDDIQVPIYSGEVPDIAMGFTAFFGEDKLLFNFALRHNAVMWKNWEVIQVPKDVPSKVPYPHHMVNNRWKVREVMDHVIANRGNIFFNLEGFNIQQSIDSHKKAMHEEKDVSKATSPDWELGRIMSGMRSGAIPRSQVKFFRGKTPLTSEEVDELLQRFEAAEKP